MPRNRTLRHRQGVLIVRQGQHSQNDQKPFSEAARGQQTQIEFSSPFPKKSIALFLAPARTFSVRYAKLH